MKRKILTTVAIVMCALLLVAGSIAGTFAYLTSTKTTTNTFTVGDVAIDLTNITKLNGTQVEGELHLIPGREYAKETYITVGENSEDCYLFVKLDNGLVNIIDDTTLETQMNSFGWKPLTVNSVPVENVYYYNKNDAPVVSKNTKVDIFNSMKIKGTVDNQSLSTYGTAKITITAYAVQAEGFASPSAAWGATFQN